MSVASNIIVGSDYDPVFVQCYNEYSLGLLDTVVQRNCASPPTDMCYVLGTVDVTHDFCSCLLTGTDYKAQIGSSNVGVLCGCIDGHPIIGGVDYVSQFSCTVGDSSSSSSGSASDSSSDSSSASTSSASSSASTSSASSSASTSSASLSVTGKGSASSSTIGSVSSTSGSVSSSTSSVSSSTSSSSLSTTLVSSSASSTSSTTSSTSANGGSQGVKAFSAKREGLSLATCLIFSIFFMSLTKQ